MSDELYVRIDTRPGARIPAVVHASGVRQGWWMEAMLQMAKREMRPALMAGSFVPTRPAPPESEDRPSRDEDETPGP